MAYYIPLRKTFEDDTSVEYSFDGVECGHGTARVNKRTGAVRVRNFSSIGEGAEPINARVRSALRGHWERCEFPETTSWSS